MLFRFSHCVRIWIQQNPRVSLFIKFSELCPSVKKIFYTASDFKSRILNRVRFWKWKHLEKLDVERKVVNQNRLLWHVLLGENVKLAASCLLSKNKKLWFKKLTKIQIVIRTFSRVHHFEFATFSKSHNMNRNFHSKKIDTFYFLKTAPFSVVFTFFRGSKIGHEKVWKNQNLIQGYHEVSDLDLIIP